MAYFYEFELIIAGIILLSAMGIAGIKLWFKRKSELTTGKNNSPENDSSASFS